MLGRANGRSPAVRKSKGILAKGRMRSKEYRLNQRPTAASTIINIRLWCARILVGELERCGLGDLERRKYMEQQIFVSFAVIAGAVVSFERVCSAIVCAVE